jgi:hypothetical protein
VEKVEVKEEVTAVGVGTVAERAEVGMEAESKATEARVEG